MFTEEKGKEEEIFSWLFLCPLLQDSVASNLGERRVRKVGEGEGVIGRFFKRTESHITGSFPLPYQQP